MCGMVWCVAVGAVGSGCQAAGGVLGSRSGAAGACRACVISQATAEVQD